MVPWHRSRPMIRQSLLMPKNRPMSVLIHPALYFVRSPLISISVKTLVMASSQTTSILEPMFSSSMGFFLMQS